MKQVKKWLGHLRPYLWVVAPVLIILVGAGVSAWIMFRPQAAPNQNIPQCVDDKSSDFECWQTRYTLIVNQQSPEVAFTDIKKEYETNPYITSNCHQLGHVIGRTAALKYKSLAETYKHGNEFCWSGYYHGAIESVAQKIGKDKIVAQLNDVCSDFLKKDQYSFDHYNCVHGMGHGLMALEDGELFTALKKCNGYEGSWQQESCFGGVFMENVMNEINPGKVSKYLNDEQPLYPCTAVEDTFKRQCYLMQTSHALKVVSYDYNKVFELCATVESPYDDICYQSLGRDVSGGSNSNQQRTIELCNSGPTYEGRENCFIGAVKDFISYFHSDTQGLAMCEAIPDAGIKTTCISTANEYYRSF
jgi:hypothetical protein